MTWTSALEFAQQHGGTLVAIEDAVEAAFVRDLVDDVGIWIGLHQDPGPNFTWTSGSSSTYRNWNINANPVEPNNTGGNERWVLTYGAEQGPLIAGTWNDAQNIYNALSVVEVKEGTNFLSRLRIAEPLGISNLVWRGQSLTSSGLRGTTSILYTFIDDKNSNGLIDIRDDFVTAEYLMDSTNANRLTLSTQRIPPGVITQSYGLASVNFLNTGKEVFFTGEPDGQVFAWTAKGGTDPLEREMFSADHTGKAWHALAAVKTLEPGEALMGLRVDPANPNTGDVILWPAQSTLPHPQLATLPQTAPTAVILPSASSLTNLAKVIVRLWDAEGNAAIPYIEYQLSGSSEWRSAKLEPDLPQALASTPTGTNYTLVWNALAALGPGVTTNVLIRARASDLMLTGDWSVGTPFHVETALNAVIDDDNLPDAWEMEKLGTLVYGDNDDPDHDGDTNLKEYQNGTDPLRARPTLALTILPELGKLRLEWYPQPIVTFYLERRVDSSVDGPWQIYKTNPKNNLLIPIEPGEVYYRIRLEN